MADGTKIEWTGATINPIRARRVGAGGESRMGWHCVHVSEACRHCYAEAINRDRFGTGLDYKPGHLASGEIEIVFVDKPIREMLRWRRPRRVFVCSMTDLFADFVPDWMIDRVFTAAALCPQHTIQILTKRPERMRAYMSNPKTPERIAGEMFAHATKWGVTGVAILSALGIRQTEEQPEHVPLPLENVWLGVTAERQQEADERLPVLLDTPAAKRFVSIEPMLGPVDLQAIPIRRAAGVLITNVLTNEGWDYHSDEPGEIFHRGPALRASLDWVICGGESGPNARPMHPDWARCLRDQCAAAGVPFFFKQWGEWGPRRTNDPKATRGLRAADGGRFVEGWDGWDPKSEEVMFNSGKSRAGRLLDGVTHDAFPEE